MTRWIAWLVLSGKRYLKRPAFLLLLLVLPVAAAFFRREEEKEQPGIRSAVYGEEEDPDGFSKQLAEKLAGYGGESGSLFSFYLAGDEEELKRDVASGKAECGYVIHEGLEEKLKGKKFKGAISLYESPSTVAGLLSTETVFSLMIEAYDKELFLDYLENGLFGDGKDGGGGERLGDGSLAADGKELPAAGEWYDLFLENGSTFRVVCDEYGERDGSPWADTASEGDVQKGHMGSVFPVRGFMAVFIFITGLYGAVTLGKDERQGLFLMLPGAQKGLCRLASLLAPVLLASASGMAALWVCGELGGWGKEAALLLLYALAVALFSLGLKKVTVSEEGLCCLIPFFLLGSLIFCPVFLDVGRFVKEAGAIGKLFLPYYYLVWF